MADNNLSGLTLYSSRAQKEIASAWNWYEERQQGLGDRFVQAVLIAQDPERYPTRYKTYRETLVPVFPFLIIYRINKRKKLVYILSVYHAARNPKKKYT